MDQNAREQLVRLDIAYDGESYSRQSLEGMVDRYQHKHERDLEQLSELRRSHDAIATDMRRDVSETRSAWDALKGMMTDDFGANFRLLLERLPLLNDFVAERPVGDILRDKIEIAELRTKEVGQFLATLDRSVDDLQQDIVRLNKKVVVAAENEERAAFHVLKLKELEEELSAEVDALDNRDAAFRQKEAHLAEVKQKIWEHGAKLRLYSSAEDRIASIVSMNNHFLGILTNLHANMQNLYDAGTEILDDLRGNLSGLTTAAEASELSLEMQKAMQGLKKSVNKVARLASSTSLYLTQNIDRMTSEMKIYDEWTKALVQSNLEAEREMLEERINDTIALAEKEYGLMQEARAPEPAALEPIAFDPRALEPRALEPGALEPGPPAPLARKTIADG